MNLDNALIKEKAPKTEDTQYKYIEIRQVGHFRLLPGNLPLSWQEMFYISELADNPSVDMIPHDIDKTIDHAENDSASGTRVDTLPIPKPVKKKQTGRGYVRVSDLIGKTEAEVRKNARLTYEESYKLKKALKGTGVIVA